LLAPRHIVLLRNALDVGKTERRLRKRLYWAVLSLMTTASLLRATAAIAVSDYARRALTRHVPASVAARVAVVPHGVEATFSPPPADAGREDFLLAVGDLYVQKNLLALVAAVARLKDAWPGLGLKIAGRPVDPEYAAAVEASIADLGLADGVELLGQVAPPDLADLYRRCAVFVFPSLVETFGNPLVEAMASGAPIVCSDAAAMPEVVGDAALLFDPTDVDALTARLGEALADAALRRDLGARARERARRYSWDETARLTAAVLKQCAAS
jgi:glycosyltransferase involved in cell wall biosynthesis